MLLLSACAAEPDDAAPDSDGGSGGAQSHRELCAELRAEYDAAIEALDQNCTGPGEQDTLCGVHTGCMANAECVIVAGSGVSNTNLDTVYGYAYGIPMATSKDMAPRFEAMFARLRTEGCGSGMDISDATPESEYTAECVEGRCVPASDWCARGPGACEAP
jgi:hypothetical protein